MNLSDLGVRAQRGTTATYGLAQPKADDAGSSWSPVGVGIMAGGALALAGGIGLRHAGMGRLGLGLAAIGAAALGVSLLASCAGPKGPPAPGDEGEAGGDVTTIPSSFVSYEENLDTTNPAPADYAPESGTRDAREGVVQLAHSGGTGSGWVVEPGTVITNYHVAQGHRELDVVDHRGREHEGIVRRLDRAHDLAIVDVPTLKDAAFKLDDVVDYAETGETTGYPDGVFRNDAAVAVGSIDIEDDGRRRDAMFFSGTSAPGVSGGAVINGAGEVMGTAFAVGDLGDESDPSPFVLAIPNDQVKSFLDASPKPAPAG
jgi:S1-C subfamily serine protease